MNRTILTIAIATAFLLGTPAEGVAQAQQAPPQAQEPVEPAQAMRDLVRDISKYARRFNRNFVVVTQGGLALIEKIDAVDATRRSPATTYMRSIDGINIQGLNFHPPLAGKDEIITEPKIRTEMVRLADLGKQRGLNIWVTDYAANAKAVADSFNANLTKGYVPFGANIAGSNYIYDGIPKIPLRPVNENPINMVGLKSVRNFLYLTDSSRFDRPQDFVIALSNTNYDAVIVDVFHRGRTAFSKAAIRGMKFKKLGARRLVLAYMNIGAAENYRYYWKDSWKEGEPKFISGPTSGNPDKFYVEYWQPGWRNVITGNTKSYIYGIVRQGFDGVVLDGLESYKFFEGG